MITQNKDQNLENGKKFFIFLCFFFFLFFGFSSVKADEYTFNPSGSQLNENSFQCENLRLPYGNDISSFSFYYNALNGSGTSTTQGYLSTNKNTSGIFATSTNTNLVGPSTPVGWITYNFATTSLASTTDSAVSMCVNVISGTAWPKWKYENANPPLHMTWTHSYAVNIYGSYAFKYTYSSTTASSAPIVSTCSLTNDTVDDDIMTSYLSLWWYTFMGFGIFGFALYFLKNKIFFR